MNQLLKKIKNEWEKFFCCISVVLAVFSLIFLVIKVMYYEKPAVINSPSVPQVPSLLNRSAFAFLGETYESSKISDPFFIIKILAKYQPKPQNNNQPPKNQPLPQKKPEKFLSVSYSGWLDSSSGEKVVFISVIDETSKQKKTYTLSEGAKIPPLSLLKIENEYIIISDENNNEHKIKLRSSKKIKIE